MRIKKAGVLILIPAYNEQDTLSETVEKVKSNAFSADLVIINDGSTDKTSEMAEQMGIKVIDLPFNLGIGGAVQTGLKYALYKDYDVVVQIDADGQHDPSYLPILINQSLKREEDIVIGSRYLNSERPEMPLLRDVGIRYFSWLTSRIIGQRITDCSSGFRALNRKAIKFFAENYPVDFPDAEALILAHRSGLKIAELPVRIHNRSKGKSSLHSYNILYYPIKETLSIMKILSKRKDKK